MTIDELRREAGISLAAFKTNMEVLGTTRSMTCLFWTLRRGPMTTYR